MITDDYKYAGIKGGLKLLTNAFQDIYTAGTGGDHVYTLIISNSGAVARSVSVQITDGVATIPIMLLSVGANAGNATNVSSIDLLNGISSPSLTIPQLPGVQRIGSINMFELAPGWKIQAKQDAGSDCLMLITGRKFE